MKNWILVAIALTTLVVMSCGKKDDGPAAVPCGPQTVPSPYFGGCQQRAQCPQGLVQNPNEPTLCSDPNTGNNVGQQQCGPGYVLVPGQGCVEQGPCPPGQASVAGACKQGVSGGMSGSSYYGGGYGASGYGASMYGSPYGASPYGASPYGAYQQQMPYGWGMYPHY